MRFGADYYPEHWPEERWGEDARLMREAGFNMVRLAEFAWIMMEPKEGEFEFEWLNRAIALLGENGIKTILGTPTAAPPAWLCHNYPQVMREDEWRRRVEFGNRQQCCINVPKFQEASDSIVRAMAEQLGENEDVIGWQTDNEFGPLCYCDDCLGSFHKWLQEKYGTLDAVNAAWGTSFWGHVYTDWHQIPLTWASSGVPNPSLFLDYRRFMADSFVRYQRRQIAILRENSPGKFITHNFMGFGPETLDYVELARDLDFASWDNYPSGIGNAPRVSISHATTRGMLHKNFIVMEEQSGPCGWGVMGPAPMPGQIRLWSFQAVGHGADGVNYFRWRPCRFGTEQYWHGILDHCGRTNRRYEEVKRTGAELAKLADALEGTSPKAEVALINDIPSRWAFQSQPSGNGMSYYEHGFSYYNALHRMNIPADVVPLDADLSRYKLVIAPAVFVMSLQDARRLEKYVADGGVLVTTFRTAVKDEYSRIYDSPIPAGLCEAFGVDVVEYHAPPTHEVNQIKSASPALSGGPWSAKVWLDVLAPREGARVLARYAGPFAPDAPAIVSTKHGNGTAFYVGTWPTDEFMAEFMSLVCGEAGVKQVMDTPENVEALIRHGAKADYLFLTNHNPEACHVSIAGCISRALVGNVSGGVVELAPFDVAVLEMAQS